MAKWKEVLLSHNAKEAAAAEIQGLMKR